ncbi:hypothetical protein VTK73DRAFT_3326 [Phialemonium thermophilum]|uniref:Translation initiation factor IF2/IF5 domain-containing protein n=1 Tax=Phialemonium thermophilum TaxID=223376 RepID=A0ABR3X0L0_9PEZI
MADLTMEENQRRKSRRSVAFTEEKIVVDADGNVTMVAEPIDDSKETAQSHTPRTPPLVDALESFNGLASQPPPLEALDGTIEGEQEANGDGLDLSLMKKKKKKTTTKGDEVGDAERTEDGPIDQGDVGEEAGLDLSMKKKKKKPKDSKNDFVKKLEALQIDDKDKEAETSGAAEGEDADGDMEKGTGIWAHSETRPIPYNPLLVRFFKLLTEKNPDHASSGSRSYKIPPPQCLREGNKKTIFANIAEICKRMKRTEEHVTAYLFAELGTTGSVDGSRRLVIKGKFQAKQIENVLRKYIIEYVTCKTCRSPDTELSKGENRLYFITCNSCGSRRSVAAIKTGFSAQVGKRRKMQG